MENKLHCQSCGKLRNTNLYVESVPNDEGKVDRIQLKIGNLKCMLKKSIDYIKLFQKGKLVGLCCVCGQPTTYMVNKFGKLVSQD